MIKTLAGCNDSKLPIDEYLQVGDAIDEEMREYFIETLPPATWTDTAIQMGEPHSLNDDGTYTYLTIEKRGDSWEYTGAKTMDEARGKEKV